VERLSPGYVLERRDVERNMKTKKKDDHVS
jgi:hypothetical protein